MTYAPECLKVLVHMPRSHIKQRSGSRGGCARTFMIHERFSSANKPQVDVGLSAGLGVVDLAELSLSSLCDSVSRDSSAMHQQGCPLRYL